ncbi:hypothetical protein AYO20_04538 [Fonsecaea nubica]|uniref:Fungal N-terminal domain-containing protein n=1 Tax=Fonsecaea nubica TaxID=856822 RepID=A0A178D419_9EURO|nr:hypothetical protein AYO20_04538 [Fonsecaea nubica]OAL36124.1 hypothetical protein AYO20_04538 [Fonsecaea nubica]
MSGAEAIFGIAASGAGLVSLSIQLVESAAKLKRMYHAARDAPRIVARLQLGLETMALALRQLEQRRQQGGASDALLARCITECELHTADIQELIDKMDDRLSRDAKIGGRIYTAFKQRDVKELLDGLEKAKSSLELVYMMYLGEEQRRRDQAHTDMLALHGCLIGNLQDQLSAGTISLSQQLTVLAQSSVLSPISMAQKDTATASRPFTANDRALGRSRWSKRTKNNKQRFQVTFRLPPLLTARIFHFAVSQAQFGWSIHLRTFNHVSYNSLIFRYCRRGNLEGVRRLIERGEATPLDAIYDKVSTGVNGWWTLVEAAAELGQLEVCKWLLSQTTYPDHGTRLSNALGWYSIVGDHVNAEMYRLILEDPDVDTDMTADDDTRVARNLWLRWCTRVEPLEVILQTHFPGFDSRTFEEKFELASRLTHLDATAFLECVGMQAMDPRLASLRNSSGKTVLHCVASRSPERHKDWLDIGLGVLNNGADPSSIATHPFNHDSEEWQATPLLDYLQVRGWESPTDFIPMLHRVHTWAEMIQQAGLDLFQYGVRESGIWRDLGVQAPEKREGWKSQVTGLVYGPAPADWSLTIVHHWTIDVYRLHLLPGTFSEEPRLPDTIAWVPTEEERDEGCWIGVERKRRVTEAVDLRQVPFYQKQPFINIVNDSQDDSGPVMLMEYRASRVTGWTRTRSCSQPPCIGRRALLDYDDKVWIDYHFCLLKSRWRIGGTVRKIEGPPIADFPAATRAVEVRSCLRGACSDTPTSSLQGWRWKYESFLADIVDCQDESRPHWLGEQNRKSESLRHKFTRDCTQGCGNIDIGRLNVPLSLRPFHPRRHYEDEDEDD